MKANEAPQLPASVSNDGRELWDWAGSMSQWIHREARRAELLRGIRECGTQCGDCYKWMHSRECPRERPGTGKRSGYSVGPSMSEPICNQFVEKTQTTKRREQLTAELKAIT